MGIDTSNQKEFQKRMQRIESLLQEIEGFPDTTARRKVKELVQLLMELHGAGLERIMDIVWQSGESGRAIIDVFAKDELVNSLLMLYGLHPLDLRTRVMQALDKVRPYLRSHNGNVDLIDVAEREGVVKLRLQGSCKSCPSSSMTLKLAIEEAIYEACPELTAIETEGVEERPAGVSFVKLRKDKPTTVSPGETSVGWEEVSGLEFLPQGDIRTIDICGRSVLFCRLGETFYAYGNICPGCGQSLHDSYIEATSLVCPSCGLRYDVIGAGRGLDQPDLYLEPLPLLVEEGRVKVAITDFQ